MGNAKGYFDIYDCVDNGGNVQDEIADMSMEEMEDFFSDADPCEFL